MNEDEMNEPFNVAKHSECLDRAFSAGLRGDGEQATVYDLQHDCVTDDELRRAWREGAVVRWRNQRRALRAPKYGRT